MRAHAHALLLAVLVALALALAPAPARAADAPPPPPTPAPEAAPAEPEKPAEDEAPEEAEKAEGECRVRIAEVEAVGDGESYRVRLEAEGAPEALRAKASFTMFIGENEGRAILRAQRGVRPPRPMTHDLLAAAVRTLGGTVERVTVTKVEEGTFHAEIRVARGGETLAIDARPSDSMALALLAGAPVFVRTGVLREAGRDPELPELPAAPEPPYL